LPIFVQLPETLQNFSVNSGASLQSNGGGLAAVLDDLKDNHPEQWDALLTEMRA
jgi:hypothetical protein